MELCSGEGGRGTLAREGEGGGTLARGCEATSVGAVVAGASGMTGALY